MFCNNYFLLIFFLDLLVMRVNMWMCFKSLLYGMYEWMLCMNDVSRFHLIGRLVTVMVTLQWKLLQFQCAHGCSIRKKVAFQVSIISFLKNTTSQLPLHLTTHDDTFGAVAVHSTAALIVVGSIPARNNYV